MCYVYASSHAHNAVVYCFRRNIILKITHVLSRALPSVFITIVPRMYSTFCVRFLFSARFHLCFAMRWGFSCSHRTHLLGKLVLWWFFHFFCMCAVFCSYSVKYFVGNFACNRVLCACFLRSLSSCNSSNKVHWNKCIWFEPMHQTITAQRTFHQFFCCCFILVFFSLSFCIFQPFFAIQGFFFPFCVCI